MKGLMVTKVQLQWKTVKQIPNWRHTMHFVDVCGNGFSSGERGLEGPKGEKNSRCPCFAILSQGQGV